MAGGHCGTLARLWCPQRPPITRAGPDLSLVCTAQKEEADHQSVIPSRRLDEDNARREPPEAGTAPEHSDNSSTEVIEYGIVLKPEDRSTPGTGRDGPSPHPGTGTRARGSGGGTGPTPSSSEGSGDLDLVLEVDGGVPIVPQGERPSEAVVGNRSSVRSEDKDDGAPRVVPGAGATTSGSGRVPTTRGAGDEGSGEATGQGQEGVKQGTGTGGIALSSVTEKIEGVQVDAAGVDEYAYIPDSGSVTITRGSLGSTSRATSFTQVSPDKDDEVNIFIGRANIHVGEQETTQAGATVGRKDDGIPSVGTSSPLPRLGVTAAPSGGDDDSISARRQPERLATTATPTRRDSVTSSLRDGRLTGEDEEGASTLGVDRGLVTPVPWRVTSSDITSPTVASIRGKDDDEVRGKGQRFKGKPDHVATTTPRQWGDMEAAVTVPAERASIRPGTASGERSTPSVTASRHKAGTSTVLGRGGSRELGTATSRPRPVHGRPKAGTTVRPGGAGLDKTPRTDKAPSPSGKPSSWASSGAQTSVGGYDGDAGGRSHAIKAGASPAPQAGQTSTAAGRGRERGRGRGGESGAAVPGAGGGRLAGQHGRRLGAGAPGTVATLGRSRQLDQVKRADELHVRERAFYSLGGGPSGPYPGQGSADSSQSSEGDRGSHSESGQTGLQPSGWGSPGYPQGRWIQGPL